MKRFLTLLAFLLVSITFVAAQGNSWGNGNPNNNQGGWNNGSTNTQGPLLTAQQALLAYLQAGNPVPFPLALDIIRQTRDWGQQQCGLNLGQMIQKYAQGQLTVDFVSTSPPSWTFRVSYGNLNVLVIDSF
jgi:hypothetical protein